MKKKEQAEIKNGVGCQERHFEGKEKRERINQQGNK